MPNFNSSNLVKAQALINQDFQNPEMRQQPAPVLALGQRNNEIITPSHSVLRTREDRPIETYIMTRNMRSTAGATRTHNHTGSLGDSMSMPLAWTSFTDKFQFSLKWLDNNIFPTDRVLANQFAQAFQNIRNDIEEFLINYLESEKTQVNIATKNGNWNATNDTFEIITRENRGLFFEDSKSMMRQNFYSGLLDAVLDPKLFRDAAWWANQGSSNAYNTSFQFGGINFVESIGLSNDDYTEGTGLILPANTFGVLDWIPRQNREGNGDFNTYVGGFGSMIDPVSGLTMAIHGYSQRADTSASNGNAQDVVIEFEVSVDISPNLAPLSNANETVVYEVAQLIA